MLLKKVVLCRNIAQNWVKTEQLIQYYNTKFSPLIEVKNLKRLVNFLPEKKWKILTSKLWKLNSLKKSFNYLKHLKDRITWLWLCNVLFNDDISRLSHVMTEQISRVNIL